MFTKMDLIENHYKSVPQNIQKYQDDTNLRRNRLQEETV